MGQVDFCHTLALWQVLKFINRPSLTILKLATVTEPTCLPLTFKYSPNFTKSLNITLLYVAVANMHHVFKYPFFNWLFQMTTIQDLSRPSSEPYVKPLKVKVARISPHGWSHYIMANGQACSKLTCMLADQTGYIRCEVFGEKFQSNFVEGKSIALRNYVINHGVLRVTSQTKVFWYVHYDYLRDRY